MRRLNDRQSAHMTYHRHSIDEPQEVVLEEVHVTANDSPAEHNKTYTHSSSVASFQSLPPLADPEAIKTSSQHTPNTHTTHPSMDVPF